MNWSFEAARTTRGSAWLTVEVFGSCGWGR